MEPEPQQPPQGDSPEKHADINTQSPQNSDPSPAEESGSETPKMAHDSMVTVRLSEPPSLSIDTGVANTEPDTSTSKRRSTVRLDSTAIVIPAVAEPLATETDTPSDLSTPQPTATTAPRSIEQELLDSEEREQSEDVPDTPLEGDSQVQRVSVRESQHSTISEEEEEDEVNWDQLQQSEAQEPREQESDKVRLMPGIPLDSTGAPPSPVAPQSTAMLLALLEKENAKLAKNPKSVKVKQAERRAASPQEQQGQPQHRPRPPSMAQLRQMMTGPTPAALRYSMLPPPPMTDLEFYLALVKDYHQTAARLPTLLSNKIRKGIPPPLRGVVWQSMSGARDAALEEQYDKFSGESSPYEPIIGKDLGRSFPGVDMFRDPEGEGQRMLGKVLKCFSLYDQKIGYCQGLAFLVGPLLMHMPDKQAFCVLVRLMERYDLRTSFLPDLSGLHVRIYQFRELLRENLPELSRHMDDLQVDLAFVSQWFLSFFAVTCPLPMLFRIYDVIFAEGAPETLMRVALSLMRQNQARILGCTEFEDVMQLLLSRGLWDCYHYDADGFVQDFVSLAGEVSREKLLQLEQGYRESQIATVTVARASDLNPVATAASRFLGRIWAASSPKHSNLSPGLTAPSRPLSMLRRSTSKQSLASTLNSMEASSASVASTASTDATTISRDSSNTTADDGASIKTSNTKNAGERNLHGQIEDLLTALSELQRNHAQLASELQKEREQREVDKNVVRSLLDGLRKKASNDSVNTNDSSDTIKAADTTTTSSPANQDEIGDKAENDTEDGITAEEQKPAESKEPKADEENTAEDGVAVDGPSPEELTQMLDDVEKRFGLGDVNRRRASTILTKSALQQELDQAKVQLETAVSQTQDRGRKVYDLDLEVTSLKDQLKDSHSRTRTMHMEKQKLEKQVLSLKAELSAAASSQKSSSLGTDDSYWPKPAQVNNGGLREFKLNRSRSTPSHGSVNSFSSRNSSLPKSHSQVHAQAQAHAQAQVHESTLSLTKPDASMTDHESLLLELVQAKTAEAMARQEADENKQKLESLRKAYGLAPGDTPPVSAASTAASAAMGVFGRLTGSGATTPGGTEPAPKGPYAPAAAATATPANATASPAASAQGGGFWGWRR